MNNRVEVLSGHVVLKAILKLGQDIEFYQTATLDEWLVGTEDSLRKIFEREVAKRTACAKVGRLLNKDGRDVLPLSEVVLSLAGWNPNDLASAINEHGIDFGVYLRVEQLHADLAEYWQAGQSRRWK